jgi:hypothetical protein
MRVSPVAPISDHGYSSQLDTIYDTAGGKAYMVRIYFNVLGFGQTLEFPSFVEFGKIGFFAYDDMVAMSHPFCQDQRLRTYKYQPRFVT